jgi:hypothetical protein
MSAVEQPARSHHTLSASLDIDGIVHAHVVTSASKPRAMEVEHGPSPNTSPALPPPTPEISDSPAPAPAGPMPARRRRSATKGAAGPVQRPIANFTRALATPAHTSLPPGGAAYQPMLREASYTSATSSSFNLGALERPALPETVTDGAAMQLQPPQLTLGRKDIHDGAAAAHEPSLRDLADSFAAADAPATTASASAVAYLARGAPVSSGTYMQLLRAALFTWLPSSESLVERLALAEWLRGVCSVPAKQHEAAMAQAQAQNQTMSSQLCARLAMLAKALQEPAACSSAVAELPEALEFLDAPAKTGWLLAEQARCRAALDAVASQPPFAGVLRVSLHSVRGLQRGRAKRGVRQMICCGAPPAEALNAPYFKIWLHGNGDAQYALLLLC